MANYGAYFKEMKQGVPFGYQAFDLRFMGVYTVRFIVQSAGSAQGSY